MLDWYFVYTAASTVLIGIIAYLMGKADGHAEGIKKGSRAISSVNKTLDELVLSLSEETKKSKMEDFGGTPAAVGKGTEITELPKTTAVEDHDNIWKDYKKFTLSDDQPLFALEEKSKPKSKKKKKAAAAEMKPKRKKGKK
jgi:hypothetical protein